MENLIPREIKCFPRSHLKVIGKLDLKFHPAFFQSHQIKTLFFKYSDRPINVTSVSHSSSEVVGLKNNNADKKQNYFITYEI